MAGGDHDAAVHPQRERGVVHLLGAHQADVDHVDARLRPDRGTERRSSSGLVRRMSCPTTTRDGWISSAYARPMSSAISVVQLLRDLAADVVRLEALETRPVSSMGASSRARSADCTGLLCCLYYARSTVLGSSMVEHLTVNQGVAGSSPARGAIFLPSERGNAAVSGRDSGRGQPPGPARREPA